METIRYEEIEKEIGLLDVSLPECVPLYRDIQDRLNKLNKDSKTKSILKSIDRPILPLVLQLNRIGLQTTFSCCGYSYRDEEEPKSHSPWTQVLFYVRNEIAFKFLEKIIQKTGWSIQTNPTNPYNEKCLIFCATCTTWSKCDNLGEALHDYEMKLHAISELTLALKGVPIFEKASIIKDGNSGRKNYYGDEWMIEPKQPFTIIWDRSDLKHGYYTKE